MDCIWIRSKDLLDSSSPACENIGLTRASGLPFFHAFTGCDVVSAFRGKDKKSAWHLGGL